MTDKQIIIDVSGCSELCGTKCHILMSCTNSTKSDSCSEMPNCYYKQLKAKEQECERLKKQLTILDDEDVVVEITVKQFEEYKKLKQTLAEIKEIIHFNKTNRLSGGACISIEQILQKISECEVE